jgi:hypothetical protein
MRYRLFPRCNLGSRVYETFHQLSRYWKLLAVKMFCGFNWIEYEYGGSYLFWNVGDHEYVPVGVMSYPRRLQCTVNTAVRISVSWDNLTLPLPNTTTEWRFALRPCYTAYCTNLLYITRLLYRFLTLNNRKFSVCCSVCTCSFYSVYCKCISRVKRVWRPKTSNIFMFTNYQEVTLYTRCSRKV